MHIRGVNLGNWLVLEKWMGSSPLASARAEDDRGLIDELDDDVRRTMLEEHYRTYVTEDDFAWLAEAGVNLVRIPVPYYLFGTEHHAACIEHLDNAMEWAARRDIGVLIDLHTVPMSQNGFDNGGYMGLCAWHKDPARIDFVLDVLQKVALRYAGHEALWGIEPLNEPANEFIFHMNMENYGKHYPERVAVSEPMPAEELRAFYERFYAMVRPIVGPKVRLVFHDRFELKTWKKFMVGDAYQNVWIDTHQYLNFADFGFKRFDLPEYIAELKKHAKEVRRAAKHHAILVGEWCLGNHSPVVAALDDEGRRTWYRALADAQLDAWDEGDGGCYWSYRVDAPGKENWSLRYCVEHGWINLRQGM